MNQTPDHRAPDPDAQQRFLSLFLASEREVFRYVAAIVPNLTDAHFVDRITGSWQKMLDALGSALCGA